MRTSLVAVYAASYASLAPGMVSADSCQATFDFFFFGWNVVLDGVTGICGNNDLLSNLQNTQGIGCIATTAFKCNDAGSSTTFVFNEPDFCGGGQVAAAVQDSLQRKVDCKGGP